MPVIGNMIWESTPNWDVEVWTKNIDQNEDREVGSNLHYLVFPTFMPLVLTISILQLSCSSPVTTMSAEYQSVNEENSVNFSPLFLQETVYFAPESPSLEPFLAPVATQMALSAPFSYSSPPEINMGWSESQDGCSHTISAEPVTRFRKKQASSAPSSMNGIYNLDQTATLSTHNRVEKRYRTNLNLTISRLRESVPSIRKGNRDRSRNQKGDTDSGARNSSFIFAPSVSKVTVMDEAIKYIKTLECNQKVLEEDLLELKARLERAGERGIGRDKKTKL